MSGRFFLSLPLRTQKNMSTTSRATMNHTVRSRKMFHDHGLIKSLGLGKDMLVLQFSLLRAWANPGKLSFAFGGLLGLPGCMLAGVGFGHYGIVIFGVLDHAELGLL